jgi:plastocyanin
MKTQFPDKTFFTLWTQVNKVILLIVVILPLIFLSCESSTDSGLDDSDNSNETSPPAANEVTMEGTSFNPGNLTIEPGTTVTWLNNSSEVHTVTSGSDGDHDGIFDSGNLNPGENFSYTFDEEGTYPYYCIPHVNVGMTGTIIVSSDSNPGINDGNSNENGDNNNDSEY